jgi:methionyl-tRNA formyltransferase
MKKNNSIVFVGCKDTTYECMSSLIELGYKIDLLITIDASTAERNNVAGYMDLQKFARENNISVYICKKYSLKSKEDQDALITSSMDLLLVIGWQRLIPEWLLERLSVGAFGMHGASKPLPFGRGRSPMNWSLIQNKNIFITNLFKYNIGVDDGDILATQIFDLNEFDTANTAHYKNTLSMINLLKKNIDFLLNSNFSLRKQIDLEPTFYPKRTESDGCIFWERDSDEIYNLIRAVTKPFPGAFTFYKNVKIKIWRGYPFDTRLFDPYIEPGKILHIFNNGDFIVKTGNGSFLVIEYELINNVVLLKKDYMLNSNNYEYQNPYIYPHK